MDNLEIQAREYKYKEEWAGCAQCPPADAIGAEREAYRWVMSPIGANCFLPQAAKNPQRALNESDAEKLCSLWGLSMFVSAQQARDRFLAIQKSFKMARKSLGSHIALGALTTQDGVATPPSNSGHFDFHEFSDASLQLRFTIVAEL